MKRVIISGGGTGGHIYPAITIANTMAALEPTEFLYVGSKNGLESQIVPAEGLPFKTLEVRGLERRLSLQNVKTLFTSLNAMIKARGIIKSFKPDVVIGTGGYVCGPILLMAAWMGIPTMIQEQNVIAGITNRILSRFVDVVAVGYQNAEASFMKSKRVVYTGNPVRPAVLAGTREEGRKYFGLTSEEFTVLIAGGSRGARSINNAMINVHKYFKDKKGIKLIHVTGATEFTRVLEALDIEPELCIHSTEDGTQYGEASYIMPYMHNMPLGLAAADLAIFRAGAVGLAELTARGIPSILIPYPYAAEDHQTYNAQTLVINGAAKMIVDKVLSAEDLISEINYLNENRIQLANMAKASRALGRPEAAKAIAQLAFSISNEK